MEWKSGTLFPFSPTFVEQSLCIKHIPQHAKSRLHTGPGLRSDQADLTGGQVDLHSMHY